MLRIESLLAEGERLLDQAREEHGRPAGVVRIAATPDFGGLLAERFFPLVVQRHPDLRLVMEPAYAFADLQDPAFDLAFRVGAVHDDRLVARELGAFERVLIASAAYLRAQPVEAPSELEHRQCLAFSGSGTRSEWTLVHGKDGTQTTVSVDGQLAAKSFRVLIGLAEASAGIALVPDFLVGDAIARGRLKRCLAPYGSPPTPVFLSYRVGSDKIQRVRAVIELALEHVPALLTPRKRASGPRRGA